VMRAGAATTGRWSTSPETMRKPISNGSAARAARAIGYRPRPNGNTPPAPVPPRPSVPGTASTPARPITTATMITTTAAPRPVSTC
jgi:hypothetical protein